MDDDTYDAHDYTDSSYEVHDYVDPTDGSHEYVQEPAYDTSGSGQYASDVTDAAAEKFDLEVIRGDEEVETYDASASYDAPADEASYSYDASADVGE